MSSISMQALFTILCHLIFIYFSYQVLSVIRFDVFLHSHQEAKARVLRIMLAIALGYSISSFLVSIIVNLQNMVFS